jgi:hypothetical protein
MTALALEQHRFGEPRFARAHLRSATKAILSPQILCLELVAEEELDASTIEHEFPTVSVSRVETSTTGQVTFDDFAWRGSFDFSRFDEIIEQCRPVGTIAVRGDDSVGVACEMLTRYQRFIVRRNEASSTGVFDDVLTLHATLYDSGLEVELAHALDTWQWTLRLDPDASLAVQVAALFHDVERLDKDARERMEHRAPERGVDKGPPSAASLRAASLLEEAGLFAGAIAQVEEILAGAEPRAREVSTLDEADALSFLSLESSPYADHFGLAQTRRKVTHTIGRLGPRAREKVALLRLRPDIERLLRA